MKVVWKNIVLASGSTNISYKCNL